MLYSGKGKKDDWPDEESDKELKLESEDEEDILKPVVKSKGNFFEKITKIISELFNFKRIMMLKVKT